jgi:hypothetical protein
MGNMSFAVDPRAKCLRGSGAFGEQIDARTVYPPREGDFLPGEWLRVADIN